MHFHLPKPLHGWREFAGEVAIIVIGVLIALAVPLLDLERGNSGVSTLPDRFASKQGFLLLERSFPELSADPAQIVIVGDVRSPAVRAATERLISPSGGGGCRG